MATQPVDLKKKRGQEPRAARAPKPPPSPPPSRPTQKHPWISKPQQIRQAPQAPAQSLRPKTKSLAEPHSNPSQTKTQTHKISRHKANNAPACPTDDWLRANQPSPDPNPTNVRRPSATRARLQKANEACNGVDTCPQSIVIYRRAESVTNT